MSILRKFASALQLKGKLQVMSGPCGIFGRERKRREGGTAKDKKTSCLVSYNTSSPSQASHLGVGGWLMAMELTQGGSMAFPWPQNKSRVGQCSFYTFPFFPNRGTLQSPPSCPTFIETIVGHDAPNTSTQENSWKLMMISPCTLGGERGAQERFFPRGRNHLSPRSPLGPQICSGPDSATMSLGDLGQHTTLLWASLYSPVKSFNKHAVQPERRAGNVQMTTPRTWLPNRGAGRGGGWWRPGRCMLQPNGPAASQPWPRLPSRNVGSVLANLLMFSREAGNTEFYVKFEQVNQIKFICCLALAHGQPISNSYWTSMVRLYETVI